MGGKNACENTTGTNCFFMGCLVKLLLIENFNKNVLCSNGLIL